MSPKLQQVRDRVRRAVSREPEAPEEEAEESAPPDEPPAREALLRSLERGRALDHALISQARALLADGENDSARALALGLREHPETEALGRLAGGIVAHREGYAELAWDLLRPVPREAWTRFAVSEYVRSGLAVAPGEVLAELRSLVADDPPEVRSKSWHDMLAPVFGYGESELARQIYERFDRHAREDENPWDEADRKRDWMRPWIAADPDSPTAPATGRRTFAVIDYGHPGADRASANLGDHVQSIASLGHLVRHQGVRLHGRDELAGLLERLRERTRPERRLDDVEAELDVITVHRDASMYEAVPEDTWTLCFGWYMHALFGIRHGFPLHRNLRPIFVSFHCNKRGLLTPEAIEYLRRYGPVGCRDWNTVFLLLSLDVPAFFSGCLTTTIDTVFPDREPPPRDAPLAYVDVEDMPEDAVAFHHSDLAVRERPFVANVERALELLETYRGEHRAVVTSRLHCYLPVRSIGADVEFRPSNRSDIRFDGLIGLDDGAFAAMREDIDGKLEQVFRAILTGRPEDEVYALWRELTADQVAEAERRRHEGAPPAPAVDPQLEAVQEKTVTRGTTADDAIHVAVVVPRARRHGRVGPRRLAARARVAAAARLDPRPARQRQGGGAPRPALPGARGHPHVDPRPGGDHREAAARRPAAGRRPPGGAADPRRGHRRRGRAGRPRPRRPRARRAAQARHQGRQRLRGDPQRRAAARRATRSSPARCAARRTRATGSTSTPSRTTCSCSTSRACAPSASASARSSWCSSTGSTTSRSCTTCSGPITPSCLSAGRRCRRARRSASRGSSTGPTASSPRSPS